MKKRARFGDAAAAFVAASERFVFADLRLYRIRKAFREWRCIHDDRHDDGGYDGAPCWIQHHAGKNPEGWATASWFRFPDEWGETHTIVNRAGAFAVKGARVQNVPDGRGDTCEGAPDVSGYCPTCRARERLFPIKRYWTSRRAGALRTLRTAYNRRLA